MRRNVAEHASAGSSPDPARGQAKDDREIVGPCARAGGFCAALGRHLPAARRGGAHRGAALRVAQGAPPLPALDKPGPQPLPLPERAAPSPGAPGKKTELALALPDLPGVASTDPKKQQPPAAQPPSAKSDQSLAAAPSTAAKPAVAMPP